MGAGERSSICCFSPLMTAAKPEASSGSPSGVQGLKGLDPLLLLSQAC